MMMLLSSIIANDLCPANCHCEDEYLRASCAHASLDIVPIQLNPEIRHLDLSNNRITTLHLAFGFYDSLESLDLSYNTIHTLGIDNFALQQRLLKLNLSNNAIRNITKNALKGLTDLSYLDLSNNNISEINHQSFRHTNEIKYINFSCNSLINLPIGLFNNLYKIDKIDLSHNSLLEMPTSNLALVSNIKYLNLSDNLIQTISKNSIPVLHSLVMLNLANNVIRNIDDSAFENLSKLIYLNMEGNNLTTLPTLALSRLNVLSSLIISHNPLGHLDKLAFRNLFELKYLDLRDCTIRWIHSRAFSDNVNLVEIKLDGNNELNILPPRMLYNLRYLKIVTLRNCNLATLEPTHLPVDNLNTLKIGGNPIVCNCSVHWLWNVINNGDEQQQRNNNNNTSNNKLSLDSHEIFCFDQEFKGKKLMVLSENSLRCRMNKLYLSLLAIGCLIATGIILVLIIYITRTKRQKRLSYLPPNRPELLVYVGNDNDTTPAKNLSRLMEKNNDDLYDLPNVKGNSETFYEAPYCNRQNTRSTTMSLYDHHHHHHPASIEGVYAVADVTDLVRETPPEVLSLYRMHSSPKPSRTRRLPPTTNGDFNYDYDYRPPLPDKPHVVFV